MLNVPSRLLQQDNHPDSQSQLLLLNKNSAGKLPSNNSLAMLKMLENFRLSAQKGNNNHPQNPKEGGGVSGGKISSKKRRAMLEE